MSKDDQAVLNSPDEITIKDLYNKLINLKTFILSKWLTILCFCLVGGLLGYGYSRYKKPIYTASTTFVLEDGNKGGALGQYSSLASLAGIDVNSGGSAFQGDNILELYKSRTMMKKTLLSKDTFDNKEQLLVDRFIDFNKIRDGWKPELKNIQFTGNPQQFSRVQDSIITAIVDNLNRGSLSVNKQDKKLSIINADFSSNDELFAKAFSNKLVKTVNEFYVETKIKKSTQNVTILQKQADSVRRELNLAIGGFASSVDAAPNANPMLQSLKIQSQKKQVDIQVSSGVYGEIVKNLEIAKMNLRQEKPLIQIIDAPVLPLKMTRIGRVKGTFFGIILALIISLSIIIGKKLHRSFLSNG